MAVYLLLTPELVMIYYWQNRPLGIVCLTGVYSTNFTTLRLLRLAISIEEHPPCPPL